MCLRVHAQSRHLSSRGRHPRSTWPADPSGKGVACRGWWATGYGAAKPRGKDFGTKRRRTPKRVRLQAVRIQLRKEYVREGERQWLRNLSPQHHRRT